MPLEATRLEALRALDILDTDPEDQFDQLSDLAAEILDTPIALVSLVDQDRQWFKSKHGLKATETPRDWSFCDHAIQLGSKGLLVVEDATKDPRFAANPLVTGEVGLRFYAGAVLTDAGGHQLGALCVIDTKPRSRPSDRKLNRLRALADLVVNAMEQRLMSRQLQEKQRLIDLAERMSGVGHWRLTTATRSVEWSDEVYRIYGVSPETFAPAYSLGLEFHSAADIEALGQKFRNALKTGEAFEYKVTLSRPDGSVGSIMGKTDVQFDARGNVAGLIGVLQDVSGYEDAISSAKQAAAAKAAFLANMTHEIRTPLTSIIGYSELAAGRSATPDQIQHDLDRVKTAGKALLATVNDILDFSNLEAGQVNLSLSPVDLTDLTRATLGLLELEAAAKDLDLNLEVEEGAAGLFELDGDRVRQILINLIGNAVKFTLNGAVTVRLSRDLMAATLRIEVLDTGPGISPEGQARLFRRFSQVDGGTSHGGGTGLGLAICRGLASAMGGELGVRSRVGEGSCFWVELPARPVDRPVDFQDMTQGGRPDLVGLRVLVADDHAINRELARLLLVSVGAEVVLVEDGALAVAAAREQGFDVVLLDIRMPVMGGVEACDLLRQAGSSLPIFAFTAEAENCGVEISPGLAFDGVISKPIQLETMVAAIADALAGANPRISKPLVDTVPRQSRLTLR